MKSEGLNTDRPYMKTTWEKAVDWVPVGNSKSRADGLAAIPATETYVWYRKFMMEYPSGLQTLHEFKTLLGLHGLTQKANQHVDQVYNTFDMNKVRTFPFPLAMVVHFAFFKM